MFNAIRAICLVSVFWFSTIAAALAFDSVRYMKQLPAAADIEAAYPLGGKDPVDAAARRAAAYKLMGVVLAKSNGRNGAPGNLNAAEFDVYRTYSDNGPSNVRSEMGWPPVFCSGDKDCERFDSLVLDYVWRDKKKSRPFGAEFRDKLFAGKEVMLPDELRYSKAKRDADTGAALLTLLAGLAVGLFAASPWARAREGAITSLGSGVTKMGGGMTYNSRNHLTVGDKRLGTTVTSMRLDDALTSAMDLGAPVRVGLGWTFWRHWALCVKGPAETVREPVFSFFIQTLVVTPILGVVGFIAAALLGAAVGSGHVSVFAMSFVAAYVLGLIVKNILAWLA
ncbi:hypothetical protein [Hyphococcus sp.]|uniref:hypothetical protein n=1 Tax=Hyphococcus sp. TaxID=2038636 RepID=UPI00208266C0|nr:MAG: hypothetical protein DHS20C04_29690 [Marinicaulis sp.]